MRGLLYISEPRHNYRVASVFVRPHTCVGQDIFQQAKNGSCIKAHQLVMSREMAVTCLPTRPMLSFHERSFSDICTGSLMEIRMFKSACVDMSGPGQMKSF